MRRSHATGAILHGLALAAALGFAYWDWTHETAPGRTGVAVWQIDPASIRGVDLATGRTKVHGELRAGEDGDDRYAWFRIERTPLAAPGSDTAPGDEPSAPRVEVSEFRGAERAVDGITELGRLEAERALGTLDAETLAGLGLDHPEGELTILTSNGTPRLEIGVKAVGDRLRYVRVPESGEVFVVPDHVVSDLELADSRLVSRDLHAFSEQDVTRAEVTVGDATRAFQRVEDGTRVYWADAERPDDEDEQVTTWMSRLERLKVERYLLEGEDPFEKAGVAAEAPAISVEPALLVRVEYRTKDGKSAFLSITRHGPEGDGALYTARTEFTKAEVVINRFLTQEAMQDLDGLFPGSAEAVEAVDAPPPAANATAATEGVDEAPALAPEATEATAPPAPEAPSDAAPPAPELNASELGSEPPTTP